MPEMPLAPRSLRRRGREPAPRWAPEPPVALPPGRLVHVPGRGEFFVRDSGPSTTPPVLLLHGLAFSSDLNWFRNYAALEAAGHRVIAMDHRGHGRGLRTAEPFRLVDCAADAAAVLAAMEATPALVAGYSMGGPIAQLLARDHAEVVRGLVLCATSGSFDDPRMKRFWRIAGLFRLLVSVAPLRVWRGSLRLASFPDSAATTWMVAELSRGSARDIAEAGRELERFDSAAWIGSLAAPAAVVVTTRDRDVPVHLQRALAGALGAPSFDVNGDHAAVSTVADEFNAALIEALRAVAG